MLHRMKLKIVPFKKIKNGSKTIELRLNDEKRKKVQIGDFIEFSCLDEPKDKIQTRVTALHRFGSFAELYAVLPKEKSAILLLKRLSLTAWTNTTPVKSRSSMAFLVSNYIVLISRSSSMHKTTAIASEKRIRLL